MNLNQKIFLVEVITIVLTFVGLGFGYSKEISMHKHFSVMIAVLITGFVHTIAALIKSYLKALKPDPSTKIDIVQLGNEVKEHFDEAIESISLPKSTCPVRKLTLIDFAGVQGETTIDFGKLTIFNGTSKLNKSVGEILRIFSDRKRIGRTRQPLNAKIKLYLSDNQEIIISTGPDNVKMSIGDTQVPVLSEVIKVVTIGRNFNSVVFGAPFTEARPTNVEGLSKFFCISTNEFKNCIKGIPTDSSLFDYSYEIRNDSDLYLKIRKDDGFHSLGVLSSGELHRFTLDMMIRIAKYSAKYRPTVLAIDHPKISSFDSVGWAHFLEWIDNSGLPFQVVVDMWGAPSEGNLSKAVCYNVVGTDMKVTSFRQVTWNEFKK